jgi:hypothetical protein
MGTLLDTTVFIELERGIRRLPAASAMDEVSKRLEEQLGATEEVGSLPLRRRNCCMACTGQRRSTAHAGKRSSRGCWPRFPRSPSICWQRARMRGFGQGWPWQGQT